jgi:predicted protein tyrosine phosphatase
MRENPVHSPFKITICGIDELVDHSNASVTHVLSILDPMTPEPDAFGEFGEHARLELRFHDVIEEFVPGYDSPQPHHIEALLAFGRDLMQEPEGQAHLLVHCHMGISRSTAAAVLLLAEARPQSSARAIMAEIAKVRSKAWPNLRMIEIGDSMLGLNGDLVQAVRDRHHQLARALPDVADFMRDNGRERELD